MIKLRTFTSKLDAQLAAQMLNENGIRTELRGAKEYVAHVLGSDLGSFDLLIDENKLKEAEALLRNDLRVVSSMADVKEDTKSRPRLYLKKAVLYSIFAIFLVPVVFNYYSLLNLKYFLDSETDQARRIKIAVLILLLQIPSIYALYAMVEMIKAFLPLYQELPM